MGVNKLNEREERQSVQVLSYRITGSVREEPFKFQPAGAVIRTPVGRRERLAKGHMAPVTSPAYQVYYMPPSQPPPPQCPVPPSRPLGSKRVSGPLVGYHNILLRR